MGCQMGQKVEQEACGIELNIIELNPELWKVELWKVEQNKLNI